MSLWEVMVSIFWFFILFAWIALLVSILVDLFRDQELSGWGKAGWAIFLIALPWIGVLSYLIVRGTSMSERSDAQARRSDQAFRQYAQQPAAPAPVSTADELAKMADLRDRGAITGQEYDQAKAALLGRVPAPPAPAQRENQQQAARTT